MADVPEAYYQFVMDYAPYAYVIPPNTPDSETGRTDFAAAFAIDFLYEAYFNAQFEDRKTEISSKIVSLANWILTQQCIGIGVWVRLLGGLLLRFERICMGKFEGWLC